MSPRNLDKAKRVVEAAKEDPERFRGVQKDMDESGNVDHAYKKVVAMKMPPKTEDKGANTISFRVDSVLSAVEELSRIFPLESAIHRDEQA